MRMYAVCFWGVCSPGGGLLLLGLLRGVSAPGGVPVPLTEFSVELKNLIKLLIPSTWIVQLIAPYNGQTKFGQYCWNQRGVNFILAQNIAI